MDVRPFYWRDLPSLYRCRRQSVFLNSFLLLTRGPLLIPGALLSSIAPNMGVFTCIGRDDRKDGRSIVGQIVHRTESQFSHLTFLTPEDALEDHILSGVIEYLTVVSGERGAIHLTADVDERCRAFEALRRSSFATYSKQRVWRFDNSLAVDHNQRTWRVATDRHAHAIGALYHNLVPGMVQQIEPYSKRQPRGMISRQDDQILAYVEISYGHRGIWVQPFVHPDITDVVEKLGELIAKIPDRRSRPVYICVRSYQSWLEPALEELGAEPGPAQAVLIKHLAVSKKPALASEMPAIEGSQPEVTATITHTET